MGVYITRCAATAAICSFAVFSTSCGGPVVQFQAVLAEEVAGPILPVGNQGVLAISNQSNQLALTCVFIREASDDPAASWGSNRLSADNPIGPGELRDFALAQGLYDIAVVRPSLDPEAIQGDETVIFRQFFVSENTVHNVAVNDFSEFTDISPHCEDSAGTTN